MADGEKSAGSAIAQGLGKGLAGMSKALDQIDAEIEAEEGPKETKSGKDALFGGREDKIREAAKADMEEEEEGEQLPVNPNPLLLNVEDFEKSVWKIQVEKNGNWFTGNYVPSQFDMAFADEDSGVAEFAGDPFTKGKWYADSSSIYFERKPLGALGPLSPGQEYFRGALRAWATDDLQLQTAGYVSGYSPLFPTAILGRFLMTRVAKITEAEYKDRLLYSKKELGLIKAPVEEKPPPLKTVDLSDELTDEEERRRLAAEWMPSSIMDVDDKKDTTAAMTKSLERLKQSVTEVGSKYMDEETWKD
eukprot:CAMPEP_0181326980 /NCGR_PEP_ID=MMETSP1101-20121128/21822_1 /TAXON_ID=46948 /ORGANISM="Rhodomonas abbreviata, Strain Caron Lab Isolate" /LENGTH=304 /DNA_ID=CAMNT_0023435539 /DNA_START=282 /DNA_END=1196 /DNA_ORIENTATION=+